ncbi:MAG: hypothetical protein C5B59_11120, partial [Bacteroidetes bacterium]
MQKNLLFYEKVNKRFILFLALVCFSGVLFAQNKTITGKVVTNESDSSLEGVTVKVKGSATSTMTGKDGSFSISAPANATLVISSVGFLSQEVAVKNQSNIIVKLATDQQSLQQVVVVGYGTVKRKDVTGAISSVTAAQIAKVPVTTLDQALQGRAAGVQVINNDAS